MQQAGSRTKVRKEKVGPVVRKEKVGQVLGRKK